ncbi:hypothetical protein MB02_08530 [Croceicoccus estronivorus]|uniref:right-handed parallel beta-helix repeat-containing protein n=1 Tax=Croceicoccus estronivorus TaxID=1172626 RepID=UPI000835C9E0|nr:right-handed parallel beta-helix repeat-containing protein [Croceicoccus estronivorus]OCC23863.1 hypothetical protein MB02_08530 [Croceicoccus estronivorus]
MKNHVLSPLSRPSRPLVALLAIAAGLAIPAGALLAQAQDGPYTVVETGKTYVRLQDAVSAIGSGKGTIAIAPGRYKDCAVQSGGDVSYLATKPGTAILEGMACEDKAALVLRGYNASVSGLVFQNLTSSDGNGAGIRLEKGNLTVAQSWFRDSQEGILTASDPSGRIVIDKSTFTNLGTCYYSAGCAHSLYIGDYGFLRVTRSRFERGAGGHYLKSRSAQVQIASNSFDDSKGRWSNYMIDLPNGSTGQITNNWFVQGPDHENHSALIAIAAEKHQHSADGLVIAGNNARLAPSVKWTTTFVADWSGDKLQIGQNTLGPGIKPFERR